MTAFGRKEPLFPDGRDTSVAPYSPGLGIGELVFVSGQGPIDRATMTFHLGDVEQETRLTLENVRAVLAAADCTMDDVVKVAVHLRDLDDFERFNRVYRDYFRPPYPARTTVQSGLGAGIRVEIDAIAVRGCGQGAV